MRPAAESADSPEISLTMDSPCNANDLSAGMPLSADFSYSMFKNTAAWPSLSPHELFEFHRVEGALFSAFDGTASRGLLSDLGSSTELTSKK